MAEYDAKIRVSADTKQAESELTKLQKKLNDLSSVASKINTGSVESGIKNVANVAKNVGTEVKNIFSRGLFAGAILGAGQLSTSISAATSNLGPFTGAVKAAGAAFSSSLGGVPAIVGNILDQVGQIPNALGLAAVAAVAFAPQLLKASSAAVGLGAAIDTAVGKQATNAIADTVSKFGLLNTEINTAKTSFQDLIKGSTLNQLNAQLQDAKFQAGAYLSTTKEAVIAANQLAVVLREQRAEQQAITDLARVAQGLRPQSVENRATNTYNVTQRRKTFLEEQAAAAAQATQRIRDLEEAESIAARNRLAAAAKQKADALREQALASEQATAALRSLEQRESEAARNRLAVAVKAKEERAAFLAGGQASPFPFGPAQRSTRRRFEGDVSADRAERALIAKENKAFFEQEKRQLAEVDKIRSANNKSELSRVAALGKGLSRAASNTIIGGAFPLLFGQSGAASAGGAIGGLLGTAFGGAGGFAGSLAGTFIGQKLGEGSQVKELAADIGFSVEQTKLLGTAFQQAGKDFDKFQQSVQNIRGLSLSIDDQAKAIQLVSTLTENYGGQIDKVTNSFTSALESGKVSQATLNQLTSQGIPIQQALADKYGVSRTELLKLAKDGKVSVQDLINTLVDLGNKGPGEITKNKTAFEVLGESAKKLGTAIGELATTIVTALTPVFNFIAAELTKLFNLASAVLDKISAQLAAGRAGALNRNITAARATAGGGVFTGLFGATSSSVDKVAAGLQEITPQKNKAGIQQNISALQQYSQLLVDIGRKDKSFQEDQTKKNRLVSLQAVILDKLNTNTKALSKIPTASTVLQTLNAPSQAPPTGGARGSNKAANDAKRLAEQTKEQLNDAFKLNILAIERLKIQTATSDQEKLENEFSRVSTERRIKFLDLQKKAKSEQERQLLAEAQLNTIAADTAEYEQKKQDLLVQQTKELYTQLGLSDVLNKKFQASLMNGFRGGGAVGTFRTDLNLLPSITGGPLEEEYQTIKDRLAELTDPINQVKSAAEGISTAFSQSFKDVITGATTAQEALANFFNSIASSFADLAAELIKEYIKLQIIGLIKNFFPGGPLVSSAGLNTSAFSGFNPSVFSGPSLLTGKASGGQVSAGTPYLVGEKGPELFMPRNSGTIIPNNAMGGGTTNVVVNVDASGSKVEGDQQQAKQLGAAVSAAVQAELIKQQRPGGLLAGTRR